MKQEITKEVIKRLKNKFHPAYKIGFTPSLPSYTFTPGKATKVTLTCDLCNLEKENWYEEDEGKILCGDCRRKLRGRIRMRKYLQTGKGKEKRKAYQKAYQQTDKFKTYQKAYQQTDKYKAYRKAYQQTDKYKAYRKTDKFKACLKTYLTKRKDELNKLRAFYAEHQKLDTV
jgi:hypothetical protein